MGKSDLPSLHLFPGDWLRSPVSKCSLAAQGLWLRMTFLMHDSERYGYLCLNKLPMTAEDVARACGTPLPEYVALLSELDRWGVPSRNSEDIIFSTDLVNAEHKRRIRRKNGRLGGNPSLIQVVNQPVNQGLIQNTDVDDDVDVGKKGAGKRGFAEDDELDQRIFHLFQSHPMLVWSRVQHSAFRKLVTCSTWDEASRLVDVAITKRASNPVKYALAILGNKQACDAVKPKSTPAGKWAQKPYVPG